MKLKSVALLIVVLLALGAGWLSASPLVEERHIESVQVTEATDVVIKPDVRFIIDPTPTRWGTRLVLVNDSGYTIERFDLYNQAMQQYSPAVVNLLTAPLESGQRVVIDLLSQLLLLNAIAERDGQPFFFAAIDSDGDYFYGEWDPAQDSWNLRITFESYRSDFLASQYPIGGATLALVNRSGKSLEYFAVGDDEVNLLASAVLPTGHRALIPRSLIKDLTPRAEKMVLHYTAYDTDGGWYRGYFYPDMEAWAITIDERMLAGRGDERYTLYVENQLDEAIWFLYAMTEEEYLSGEWGDDLLGMQIIQSWESEPVDLSLDDRWAERLQDGWEGEIYLVAETNPGSQYLSYTELSADSASMFATISPDRRIETFQPPEKSELILYNRTGGALWYLYAVTSLDSEESDLGEDLLGEGVWDHDEYLTLSVDDVEEVARTGVLRLYAVDPDGTAYAQSWAIGGERLIVFRPGDRVE